MKTFFFALLLIIFTAHPALSESSRHAPWQEVVTRIETALTTAVADYRDGGVAEVDGLVSDSYFDIFEAPEANMEIAVRRFLSAKKARHLERSFKALRKAVYAKVDADLFADAVGDLLGDLRTAAAALDEKGVALDVGYN